MAQWKIKQFGDLTGVSVRTLHHYDKIGLLNPYVCASNGYRLYSEQNLVELQEITSLKFFGFSLSQIKIMLQKKQGIKENLIAQQKVLKEQIENLKQTQNTLSTVMQRCDKSKALNWKNFVALIEKSKMVQEIKKTWASKLDKDQQKLYIEIRQKYPTEIKGWEKAVEYINGEEPGDLEGPGDPGGPEGEKIVKAFLEFQKINAKVLKDSEYRIFFNEESKAIETKVLGKNILSKDGMDWFAKAIEIYSKSQKNKNYKD